MIPTATVTLYGHNQTRPGIDPPQWYGVTQWRTTEREAREDMGRAHESNKRLAEAAGFEPPHVQHRIEIKEFRSA